MTENPEAAEEGIADALQDLSRNSRSLVRQEISAAQQEMMGKAKQAAPAFALLAAAVTLGTLATAASYRVTVRLLEKFLPPVPAALAATAGYGAGAAYAGVLAVRRIRQLPPLLPTDTARQAKQTIANAAAEASDSNQPGQR